MSFTLKLPQNHLNGVTSSSNVPIDFEIKSNKFQQQILNYSTNM